MMSHQTSKSLPDEHNVPKASHDHAPSKDKYSCHTASAAPFCHELCHSSKMTKANCNSTQRVKRLKTRKERNQIRGQERNGSHTCPQHSRKEGSEKAQIHYCLHRHSFTSCARKVKAFAKPFSPQKPSIITEGRLTSIRGLFSHEIKSIDIERLVSEQIKRDKKSKEQRKQSMTHSTSPLPPQLPSVPDSGQDCTLDDAQEPLQQPGNNTLPVLQVRTKKSSRKGLTRKHPNVFQTNRVAVPMGSPREDGKHDRNDSARREDTNSKTRPYISSSPRATELMVLSSSENEAAHQLSPSPAEANKNYSDIPQMDSMKSQDEGNNESRNSTSDNRSGFINIQRLEKTSTMARFPNIAVPQIINNPTLSFMTSRSEMDSGTVAKADNVKQGEQMSVSVRKAMKRLAARLCQAVELPVPNRRCPLLEECREVLLQTLQKRHGFQLENNLHRLQSLLNVKETHTQFSSGQRHEDHPDIHLNHLMESDKRECRRNKEIWTEEDVKQDLDKGASIKKRRIQDWKTFSLPVSQNEPLQSHTDMSLQFDQCSAAGLSENRFSAQHHPSTQLFCQDKAFTQHAASITSALTWVDHPFEPCSQQLLGEPMRRGEICHQWKEETDPNLNSYSEYQSRKQIPQEASLGESRLFWSHQLQIQEVRERFAPFSVSADLPSEGFKYKPFYCFPHPSNSQHRFDWLDVTLCPRDTLDRALYPPHYL
ncbi:uncharacterized protein si:dkey-250k15.4 [Myxocyprinus asiaticus]|uniref:uncharacterized protein si:dkey-250k15.4 n=1 Tax=Myxocyprinus asiaticus TaxID=70543 RepID=UPI00222138A8|nr:uncharacterized protein si:dkey-250k15.4 [Myxocyprinus asiaticus]XP_051574404.1 uncharacterized protein si:dkey-250k15.4 [Myxocyprinus asiaticus]